MIKSMTGYGVSKSQVGEYDITIEIKSINHRYFEICSKISSGYYYMEDKIKQKLYSKIKRGKIDVVILINKISSCDNIIEIDKNTVKNYVDILKSISKELDIKYDLSINSLINLKDIFIMKTKQNEDIWNLIEPIFSNAIDDLLCMKEKEGECVKKHILNNIFNIKSLIKKIENYYPNIIYLYKEKLYNRLTKFLNDKDIDDNRILLEAGIIAEKYDIEEEIVRVFSHINQLSELLESDISPIGRKLDFIVQEINREINTISSKSQNIQINELIIDIKAEVEKIREQIQNIE